MTDWRSSIVIGWVYLLAHVAALDLYLSIDSSAAFNWNTKIPADKEGGSRRRNKAGWRSWNKAAAWNTGSWLDNVTVLYARTGIRRRHDDEDFCFSSNAEIVRFLLVYHTVINHTFMNSSFAILRSSFTSSFSLLCRFFSLSCKK